MKPRKLSHFTLIEPLGSGAIGVVFRAIDQKLGRTVAIKLLHPHSSDDTSRKRLLAEAQAASAINHPAVVTIHEVGQAGSIDFIAMEYVAGRTLADELAVGPIGVERTVRLAAQIADGLAAAHRLGLVHRDLKPGNIMVTEDDRVRILDFGLVKRIALMEKSGDSTPGSIDPETLTAAGTVLGTPAYMSPEQVRGEPVGAASDLFSLGCMLHEMLTGQRLYSADTPVQSMMAILGTEAPRLHSVPESLADLVEGLLARDPAGRPASAKAVREQLLALDGQATQALPVSVTGRSRWWKPALGAAFVVAAVAVMAWLYLPGPSPEPATADTPVSYAFRLLSESVGSGDLASFSPDGESVAFLRPDNSGVPQIWVMSVDGGQPRMITEGPHPITGLDWSPRGDRIVYARAGDGIWLIPALGGADHRILPTGQRPRWAEQGEKILFNDQRLLWLADSDGGRASALPGLEPVNFSHLSEGAMSPDGQWIAYFWPHPDRPLGNLWLLPATGGTPRQLADLNFFAGGLDWQPDSGSLIFSSDHGGSRNLWQISIDDGSITPLTVGTGDDMHPRISRDGRRIVYTNQRNRYAVDRMDPISGQTRRLLERRMSLYMLEVRRDGLYSTFFGRTTEGFHIFLLDNSSGQTRQLTRGRGAINTHPRWDASGKAIYYYSEVPQTALRRIDLETERDELVIEGWAWARQGYVSPSADERHIAYLLREEGRYVATRIHRLTDGSETDLSVPMYGLNWASQGEAIIGATGQTADGRWIKRCEVNEGLCRRLTQGDFPWLSDNESDLYFLRLPGPTAWHLDLATGEETALEPLPGFNWITFNWGMGPDQGPIWSAVEFGDKEVWLAEAQY